MSADPAQVVRILRLRDHTPRLAAGRLVLSGPDSRPADPDMRQFARHFRTLIVAELNREATQTTYQRDLERTAANILALTAAERLELHRELKDALPDDPDRDFDRAAWRLAQQRLHIQGRAA